MLDLSIIVSGFTECIVKKTGREGIKKYLMELNKSAVVAENPEFNAAVKSIAADFLAICDAFAKNQAETELRILGNFIEDLIFSSNPDTNSIENRFRAFDCDITQPHRVLISEIDYKKPLRSQTLIISELVETAQTVLKRHNDGLVICRNGELIMLYQQHSDSDGIDSAQKVAEEIIEEVKRKFNLELYFGIGTVCLGVEDFKNSYQTAKNALEISRFMVTEGYIRSFERFDVHELFLNAVKPEDLQKYSQNLLSDLLDYDAIHKTEYIKTLREYLYLRNSIVDTAKSINISVSGLKYRLKRIEQIINRDLNDYKVCFSLQLALIVFQLYGVRFPKTFG